MWKFVLLREIHKIFFIFFFFLTLAITGMELSLPLATMLPIKSHASHVPYTVHGVQPNKCFDHLDADFKRDFERGLSPEDVFAVQLLITPDEKNVVIARKGAVSLLPLTKEYYKKENCLLMEHTYRVKHAPMVAVAERKGELCVASAANYFDKERQRLVAECIVYYRKCSTKRNLTWPIQAIALNDGATKLAMISHGREALIINLDKDSSEFGGIYGGSSGNRLVDITLSPKSTYFFIADTDKRLLLMDINQEKEGGIANIKQVASGIDIKHIYNTEENTIFCSDSKNKIHKVTMYDVLEPKDDLLQPSLLFRADEADSMIFDPVNGLVATWKKNKDVANKAPHQIVVKKMDVKEEGIFKLEVPIGSKGYNFMSGRGKMDSGASHICEVALRGNCIVVLTSEGKLYWWLLPCKNGVAQEALKPVEAIIIHPTVETVYEKEKLKKDSPRFSMAALFASSRSHPVTPRSGNTTVRKDHRGITILDDFVLPDRNVEELKEHWETIMTPRAAEETMEAMRKKLNALVENTDETQ